MVEEVARKNILSDRENGPEQSIQNAGEGFDIMSCTNTEKSGGGRSRKSRKERKQSKNACKVGDRNINPSKFINCAGMIGSNAGISSCDPSDTTSLINSIKIARLDLHKSDLGGDSHMCSMTGDVY
jgi:hypothetical protein